ncbi:MAG: WecB/TagA/CpsF family glycosyltransferase [Bacteroidales bacterium]|nr:WecB/TagA/CpsF family glycosyltransferase [Bacteroidales bacterium]
MADGNILVQVHRDKEYRQVVGGAMFSTCDSSWVPLYLRRLYGFTPPQYSGSDIFRDLTGAKKYKMAFLGASQEVLDALKEQLRQSDPRIADMLFLALPFAGVEAFDYPSIADQVNEADPDIIWVALGAPKQERFAARLTPLLHRGVVIPVGAVFNFRAGLGIKRAPQWMVRGHLEFLYRIFTEPRKQLRRVWQILRWTPAILREERGRQMAGYQRDQ